MDEKITVTMFESQNRKKKFAKPRHGANERAGACPIHTHVSTSLLSFPKETKCGAPMRDRSLLLGRASSHQINNVINRL
jgi:hypothetical protein